MSNENDNSDGYNHGSGGHIDSSRYNESESYRQGVDDGRGPPCFPGETPILTPSGIRRIDTLRRGDMVLSWNSARACLVSRPITAISVHTPTSISTVELVDGQTLRVTPNHTVLSDRGWKRVDALKAGDALQASSQGLVRIAAITPSSDREKVYNLTTKGEHNFIAGGVVAHNFTTLRRVRTMLHRAVEAIQARRPKSASAGEQLPSPVIR